MPKTTSLPKYRLHKARNLAVVTIHGKDHYLGPHGSPESHQEYARLLAEHFGNGSRLVASLADDQADITISEVIARYLTDHVVNYYVKKDRSPADRQYHIKLALRPLWKLYGSTLAKDFGPRKLKAVRNEMINEGVRSRGGLMRQSQGEQMDSRTTAAQRGDARQGRVRS